MSKASGKAEFRTIAVELELGIRQNHYSGRLPNIQTLMQEFDVSKQTMTRALALLQKNGILHFKGRSGMLIDRSGLKKRRIGLVTAWTTGRIKDTLSVAAPFMEKVNALGYNMELLRGDNAQHTFVLEQFINDYDGFIFSSRPQHESVVQKLFAAGIPFAQVSALPWAPQVDSAEFDLISAISRLAEDLKKWGYRKIALLYSNTSSGLNDQIYTAWRKIKKELALPRLSCDKVRFRDRELWEKNALLMFEHIKNMKDKPEVLIHFGGKFDTLVEYYSRNIPEYPFGMKIVCMKSLWEKGSFAPDDIVIKADDRSLLLPETFHILLERFLDPQAPPIHRKLPFQVEYLQRPSRKKTS